MAAAVVCVAGAAAAAPQAQARQIGGVGITVYDDINYRGGNATFRSDQPDLGRAGFGGRISSLQVAPGEMWKAAPARNDQPPCQVFSGAELGPPAPRLERPDSGLLRRVRNGGGGGGYRPPQQAARLVLYDGEQYRGGARSFDNASGNLGSAGSRAQSVQVIGTWQLCEGPDFTGPCVTITQNVPESRQLRHGQPDRVREAVRGFMRFMNLIDLVFGSIPTAFSFRFKAGRLIVLSACQRAITLAAFAWAAVTAASVLLVGLTSAACIAFITALSDATVAHSVSLPAGAADGASPAALRSGWSTRPATGGPRCLG